MIDIQMPSNHPVRVLLADGEDLVRARWRGVLEAERDIEVAEASSGSEAIELAGELCPDVVVMNVRLPGIDGIEVTRRMAADPDLLAVNALLLSDDPRDEDVFAALRAGASGFLTMETNRAELLHAVRVLANGGMQLAPSVTRRLVDELVGLLAQQRPESAPFGKLSVREREVVTLVAAGLTNYEIAARLVMSPATAKTHLSRSMIKLHVTDRAKLIALAYQTGFA
jgi:DNA-binding NarL/FixJ family response regulator